MPMLLPFVLAVQRLNRQGLPVAAIAARLGASPDDVIEAHRLLALPANDADAPVNYPSVEDRAAQLDRMPRRMQDRIRRSRSLP
ncbi:MAG: hypothetical protein U1F10_13585 [Burkholderiales bacterium]